MYPADSTAYFYLILAAVLLGLIILYFILAVVKQQRRYQELNAAKIAAEINTLEAERKRIASDLHDELGPVLSSAKNILQSIDGLTPASAVLQKQAIEYIDSIIFRMRQIAKSLMPYTLLRKGLVFAIVEFIEFTQHKSVQICFEHTNIPPIPEEKVSRYTGYYRKSFIIR